MINKFLTKIEFNFIPSFILIVFPSLWVISNYEIIYLLNDEIIFDCVLLLLVIYVNSLLSTSNLKSTLDAQEQFHKLSIFILYYLITSRYFLLRKKKYELSNLLVIFSHLDNLQPIIFKQYTAKVHANVVNDIKDHLLIKLRSIVSMKRVELITSIQDSYKDKLFILI